MGTALRRAQRKADKRQALDCAPDQQAARKEKTRGAVAMKGQSDDPGDFFNRRNEASAKAGKPMATIRKGTARSHLVTTL
jgi:hypothetical protein